MKYKLILGFLAVLLSGLAQAKVMTYNVVLSGSLTGDSFIFGITGDASGDYKIYGEMTIEDWLDPVTGTEARLLDMSFDIGSFTVDMGAFIYETFFDLYAIYVDEYYVEAEQCFGCDTSAGDLTVVQLILNNKYFGGSGFTIYGHDHVTKESETLTGDVSFQLRVPVSEPNPASIFLLSIFCLLLLRKRVA